MLRTNGCGGHTNPSDVAPDDVLRPQPVAVGQLDVDTGVVQRDARDLSPAVDVDREIVSPSAQEALDVVLPQPEHAI